jgi:intein-encoded DNA endonuclease-like protein
MQIEVALDLSFSFLLNPKNEFDWILKNNEYFMSFLAGFVDAEGSIFIGSRKKLGVFEIGNYDKELLLIIQKKLLELGIKCVGPYEDKAKGMIEGKYIRKQNYFNICIYKQEHLLRLFKFIGPHLKHKKKINDMKKVIKFINLKENR